MKVILNKCYGGFGVSEEGYRLYAEKKGFKVYFYEMWGPCRYRRVEGDGRNLSWCFMKDFGPAPEEKDLDWGAHLYLDGAYRCDPTLVEVVEELGEKASGPFATLRVVDIPDGMEYVIDEYDGVETLHEKVRVW